MGIYPLGRTVPLEAGVLSKVKKASDWKMVLGDHNNFQLYGTGKNIRGYWHVDRNGEEYLILFHSGPVTTVARFNGKDIYFEKPDQLVDSLFREATFTRSEGE
ncbi:MAG TPA: hypothetical protein VHK69_14180 [Chitinophagaceae bacterium]|nr:hypothetical protein [Chitinophagaceae bacterium]